MKPIIMSKFLLISFIASSFLSCDEYDLPKVGYEAAETPTDSPVNPPTIDPSWNLERIINIGQNNPNVFVYKDKKYDALFTRTLGWNGGDGVFTTDLPGGNVFWSFNDSWYGVTEEATRTRRSCNFPRNSLMIQKGTESAGKVTFGETGADQIWLADMIQVNDPSANRYYQARTHIRHPNARLQDEQIAAGDIDNDYIYWAGDGTVYNDPDKGNVFQMTWGAVDLTAGGGSMTRFGTCLAEYSLEGTPGDGKYMSLLSRDDNFNNDNVGYGSTLFEDEDGHIYLYTSEAEGFNSRMLVARTETRDLKSPWSYYIRDLNGDFQWQSSFPTKDERTRSYIQNQTGTLPWVFKSGDYYYMTFQSFPFGQAIYIARSEKPYGPFDEQKLLFSLPKTLDKMGEQYFQHWYMINLHTSLSRGGELVFSTNSDTANFGDNFNKTGSADFYRPYFFRVFNWESLYKE